MDTRITRYRNKKLYYMKKVKFLIGAVLLTGVLGSGVSIAFAKQDVHSLLTNWFTSKRGTAVEEIKDAIENERDIQIGRIQEQLQIEIQQASQYIDSFTIAEKEMRTSNLRNYADELINNMVIDKSAGESSIQKELDSIYQEAIREMEKAMQGSIPGNSPGVEAPQPTPVPEPTTEVENEEGTGSDEKGSETEPGTEVGTEVETIPDVESDNPDESDAEIETEIIQEPEQDQEIGSDDRKGLDI
ncbi:hypothetical protein [Sporosarcina sp. SAFN-015]|uniref:hypothetical protein n=1 Tax=Sporosarcina sp. SAFN-015 TaxID=3387274 RepID=UPI003F7E7F66